MKRYPFIILILLLHSSCMAVPKDVPTGTWKYRLLTNGVESGTAEISSMKKGNHYITETVMKISMGDISSTTRNIITETIDFRPVKLETYNTVNNAGRKTNINTVAVFNGKTVNLDIDGRTATVSFERPFIIDGNYLQTKLIKQGFKKGAEVSAMMYEPTMELESLINIRAGVMGKNTVMINNKKEKLFHVIVAIENQKTVDLFIDSDGIARKSVVVMLNNRIELEIIDKE